MPWPQLSSISGGGKIAAAIVIASSLFSLSHYLRPVPNRYEFDIASGGQLQRFDKVSGETLFCDGGRCYGYGSDGSYTETGLIPEPPANTARLGDPIDYDPFPREVGDHIEVQVEGGTTLQFPRGTAPAVIERAVREHGRTAQTANTQ